MTLLWLFDLVEEIDCPLFETFFILFSLFSFWWWWILALLTRKDNLRYFQPCGYFSIVFMARDPSAPCIIKNWCNNTFWRKNVFVLLRMLLEEVHALSSDTKPDYRLGHVDISAPNPNLIGFCHKRWLSTDSQNDFLFQTAPLLVKGWHDVCMYCQYVYIGGVHFLGRRQFCMLLV